MKTDSGNLWTYPSKWKVVTTNGIVTKSSRLVMGGGVALQCRERFPDIDLWLGKIIKRDGNKVVVEYENHLIFMPTKNHWKDPSPIELVLKSAMEMQNLEIQESIVLPPPGCGLGGLKWKNVGPELEKILDDRFIVLI